MMRKRISWGGNILFFGLTILVNGMATSIPLGGQTPPEISARYPSLFTPAGFTFSIWAVIYFFLLLFVIYQSLPSQRATAVLSKIDLLFKVSCMANAAWIIAWHYNYLLLSVLVMLCILASLVGIYRVLDASRDSLSSVDYYLVKLPFSLYTAWISVATIANISAVQNAMGFDNVGTDTVTWTLLKLAIAGAIGASMVLRKHDIAFILVVAWAAYGISVKQSATAGVTGGATTLMILALLLALFEVARRISARSHRG